MYQENEFPMDDWFIKVDENTGQVLTTKEIDREAYNDTDYFEVTFLAREQNCFDCLLKNCEKSICHSEPLVSSIFIEVKL